MSTARRIVRVLFLTALWVLPGFGSAADWPMWRCDAQRSGQTDMTLPDTLYPQWVRTLPAPQPAFENPRLQFDGGYEPIVLGQTLYVGSSHNDCLWALDTATGRERWRFEPEGPIRLAPVGWDNKIYVGSDDGQLYCLDARTGQLHWAFRAVPSPRRVLGNGRMISVWPIRGGPVVQDGRVYFAAGVWPGEGVFLYALDAQTGAVVWRNDRASFLYGIHPHGATAFGGITPQGYLLVSDDELIVPCGSAYPACLDRGTGEIKSFQLPSPGRVPGGWFAALSRARRRGEETADPPRRNVLVYDRAINTDRHEDDVRTGEGEPDVRRQIRVGDREFLFDQGYPGVEGPIHAMLAGDDKLFVVTVAGQLYCFGPQPTQTVVHPLPPKFLLASDDDWTRRTRELLEQAGTRHGWTLVLGAGSGRLVEELLTRSEMKILVAEPDRGQAAALRRRLDDAGRYGSRVAVLSGPLLDGLPPYFASLVAAEQLPAGAAGDDREFVQRVFGCLRPYGGMLGLCLDESQAAQLQKSVAEAYLAGAELRRQGDWTTLRRAGALPGAANYTGQWQANADALVRAPLGVLWYDDDVGFFKRAPQPLFVDGVMRSYDKQWLGYPQGDRPPYRLSGAVYMDAYTGRALAAAEIERVAASFPDFDPTQKQPSQYRPPTQRDPWAPQPPVAGERVSPLTGQLEPRAIPKSYGCDGGLDYGYLYTVRSGTAAFYDKRLESGTINISGPRSGCTNSIVPACGLLNLPYYYKGCTCSYPLPTSVALVSMPAEFEQWSSWGQAGPEPVRGIQRVGVNLGAPGDRMTETGTLWLDYPSVGGLSPVLAVSTEPEAPRWFYQHSLFVRGGQGWPWVVASGAEGLSRLKLDGLQPGRYLLRLYFAEPAELQPGQRVFDVSLPGRRLLERFDVAGAAGGPLRGVVREFDDVESGGSLELQLDPQTGRTILSGIELIPHGLAQRAATP